MPSQIFLGGAFPCCVSIVYFTYQWIRISKEYLEFDTWLVMALKIVVECPKRILATPRKLAISSAYQY